MTNPPMYAAVLALLNAVLDALTLFGVVHVSADQRVALVAVFTSLLTVAGLVYAYLHQQHILAPRGLPPGR